LSHLYSITSSTPFSKLELNQYCHLIPLQAAIYGNFSAPKVQEIVVSRGKVLELLRPDDQGRVQVIHSTEVFGTIRSLQPFRFPGGQQDYVIAGSDSGRIVILQYSKEKNAFVKIHQETFGKSGSRRIVPGQYLAVDPKGRACMIGAVEKQKFVYVLNRDNEARLTISSPLEAHKSHHIVYDIVGLDMGFDNPQFAAIELDYADADADPTGEAAAEAEKLLVIYELDLGLNTVTRKHADPIDSGANMLIAVPGPADGGPGGVIVCAENFMLYRNPNVIGEEELRVVIPRRADLPGDRSVLITAAATLRQKNRFFVFVQSEYGDIYKVTLNYEGEAVSEIKMKYFDSIPPAVSLCIFRRGFLFAASEFGDHALYQFLGLGDDDAVESSSNTLQVVEGDEDGGGFVPVFFDPRSPSVNLELIDRVESLSPILDMKVANLLGEQVPQIFTACGRGPRSTLRVLRPGLAVTEMASSSLPGVPTGIWTLRKASADEFDSYIVVSFANATLVLKVGETVEQATDTGLAANVSTLKVQHLADDSILQVTTSGLRHVRPDGRVNEWKAPGRRAIARAAANERQVVIALSGGELVYFELSAQGMLVENEKRELGGDVASLDVGPIPEGRQRSKFLAIGSYDNAVRILSLDPGDGLRNLATQMLRERPESLLLLESPGAGGGAEGAGAGALFLQVGLSNGVLQRTEVDPVTGQLSDTRTRAVGIMGPRLAQVSIRGDPAMLVLAKQPWLGYSDQGKFNTVPISCDQLDYAASFASEQCPEGFVAVSKSTLRVLAIERLGDFFNAQQLKLRYTPRKLVIHPDYNVLLLAEADSQAVPLAERGAGQANGGAQPMDTSAGAGAVLDAPGPESDETTAAREEQLGGPIGSPGQWASCLRLVDPATLTTTHCLELDNGEAALTMTLAAFDSAPEAGALLCVGTAKNLRFNPRSVEECFIRVYKISTNGQKLEFLHSTAIDGGIPRAMVAYRGRLLVGMGSALRLYDLGKKRLLRKCEYRGLPWEVSTLHIVGPRIYVGDAQDSFLFIKYKKQENKFYVFADDTVPRHITAAVPLDYDTIAGGDRFGNISVLRLPPEVSAAVEEDPTAGKYATEGGHLGGAPNRLQSISNFHVGEAITAVERATMQEGGHEFILYATINGAVGALYPFTSKEHVDFFQHLEMHMRQEAPPLLGRDHLAFRSAYIPVKDVIDGDLCSQFGRLPAEKIREVALGLDRTPGEVKKMMEDLVNSIV
jgi:splicing factor 3B subunit 3